LGIDECTSALDPTSRTLVFSALKAWRRNRTTIVITHDLSQIEKDDFVYVMKDGSVVEQGYRLDLSPNGEFGRMARVGGNEDEESETEGDDLSVILEEDAESHHRIDVWTENNASLAVNGFIGGRSSHQSGTWGFGIPTAADEDEASASIIPIQPNRRTSALPPQGSTTSGFRQANTLALAIPYPVPVYSQNSRVADQPLRSPIAPPSAMTRYSIPAPSSPPLSHLAAKYLAEQQQADLRQSSHLSTDPTLNDLDYDTRGAISDNFPTITEDQYDENDVVVDDDQDFQEEKQALEKMAAAAASHRGARPASDSTTKDEPLRKSIRIHHSQISQDLKTTNNSSKASQPKKKRSKQFKPPKKAENAEPPPPLGQVLRRVYKSIPYKPLLVFGIICCLVTGAVTPIFSFLLSRLLFEISIGAKDKSITNLYGGIIFATAFADGLFNGLKYLVMESCAVLWIHSLRKTIYLRVLKQDKKWFDRSENKSEGIVHVLFKDGEDAKLLIGRILGQTFLVAAMLGLGLIWALILGWQLTLAGFAIAPIFAGVMGIQATLVNKFQKRNKQCHEAVAKGYHEVCFSYPAP
jgi:ATP-binding cassette subfamily B (MDR/TAP) protein 1